MFQALVMLQRKVKALTRRVELLEKDSHPPQPVVSPAEFDRKIAILEARLTTLEGRVD